MAYTTIDDPSAYFKVQLYTGTGSSHAVAFNDTDTTMQPDLVWIKQRDDAVSHFLFDSVRGTTKWLKGDDTTAENTDANSLTAFGSDGFTVGTGTSFNNSSSTYVAWCGKESATAGFDINIHTGTGSSTDISHNLSAVPEVIFTKRRNTTQQWFVYTKLLGAQKALFLDSTSAESSQANAYDAAPTSSVINYGNDNAVNGNTDTYVAYLWKSVQGFCKVGKWIGNANANGPVIHCGFTPSIILYKNTDGTDNWILKTKNRQPNPNNYYIKPDEDAAEVTSNTISAIDFLSNGFKVRATDSATNGSDATYVYIAFAESPLVNSNGVPATAV